MATQPGDPERSEPVAMNRLRAWRDQQARETQQRGEAMFLGRPDAWFEDPHWFCCNGHVSGRYLGTDHGPCCLACHTPVVLGPKIGEAAFAPILSALKEEAA